MADSAFTVSLLTAYLYLRYTHPVYQALILDLKIGMSIPRMRPQSTGVSDAELINGSGNTTRSRATLN